MAVPCTARPLRELLHRTYALKLADSRRLRADHHANAAAGLHMPRADRYRGQGARDRPPRRVAVNSWSARGNRQGRHFGVAKATHTRSETMSGTVKGKINYLSPEQCRGRLIDRRSDLFCRHRDVGYAGRRPAVQKLRLREHGRDLTWSHPRPSALRVGVPPEVDEIVMRLLARIRRTLQTR